MPWTLRRVRRAPLVASVFAPSGGGGGNVVTAVDFGSDVLSASGTSVNYTNLTISGGLTNSALAVFIDNTDNGGGISGMSATWDSGGTNQAMTQVATEQFTNFQNWIFGLLSPTAGNKTLTLSWTGTGQVHVSALSMSGVNQASIAAAFANTANGLSLGVNPASTTAITSQANDLVLTVWTGSPAFSGTFSGTQISLNNAGNIFGMAASYDPGAASVTATAGYSGSNNIGWSSIDVVHS